MASKAGEQFTPLRVERESEFVGRDRELSQALQMLDAALDLSIGGPRGIGKTRFAAEVATAFSGTAACYSLSPSASDYDFRLLMNELVHPRTRLLVLDDLDNLKSSSLEALHDACRGRAELRLVLVGNFFWARRRGGEDMPGIPLGRVRDHFELKSLGGKATLELAGIPLDAVDAPEAVEYLRGNPRLALGVSSVVPGPHSLATVIGPDGLPLAPGSSGFDAVELAVKGISDELIARLAERPDLMYDLDWRRFEELVAELYERDGYEVELTRGSKDGGVDIYALHRAPHAKFVTVVDCKKQHAGNPVGVELVKQLRSTAADANAHKGVIATTSYFTKGAKDYRTTHEHLLGLQDFVSVHEMLRRAKGR